MEQLIKIVEVIENTPPEVLAAVVAGLPLAAFQQKLNKWFNLQKDWVKQSLTALISLLAVGIPYALNWVTLNPDFFGAYAATVGFAMTLFYRFIVKPASNNLADFKEYKQNRDLNKDTEIITPAATRTPGGEFLGE